MSTGRTLWCQVLPLVLTLFSAASTIAAEQRDPMRPPPQARPLAPGDAASASPQVREMDRLVAIRQDGAGRWQALFGERWLAVGARLDKFTVASIEANTVALSEGRNRRVLTLLPLFKPTDTKGARSADLAQAPTDASPLNRTTAMPKP